jgi:hypothetical protein
MRTPRNKSGKPKVKGGNTKRRPPVGTSLLTAQKRAKFIQTLRDGYSVAKACRAINVSRQFAYDERKRNADFAAEWEDAIEDGGDAMEDRLSDIGNSSLPGNVTAMIFLLKGRRPEKYRERADVTNSDNAIVNAFAEAMMQHGANDNVGDRNKADTP